MKKIREQVILELIKNNFIVKALHGCFDIVARKDDKILFIKVLEDANSITPDMTHQLLKAASALHASPLIISDKATSKLKDNVIYTRYNIPTVNLATFTSCLNNAPLYMVSKQSGVTAQIIGSKLKEMMEKEEVSLGKLSRVVGVSKRMLLKYENEDAEISVQRAIKMYGIFGDQVFKKIDIFSAQHETHTIPSSDIAIKYEDLGFMVTETRKVPFDMVANKENTLILTSVGDKVNKDLNNISKAIGASDLAIFTKKKPVDIPAMTKEEFLEFEKAAALIKFIQEY